jgi:hypothetical protein
MEHTHKGTPDIACHGTIQTIISQVQKQSPK